MIEAYDPAEAEPRWRARWEADGLYEADLDAITPARKLYNLVEFPYPSAEGLHVGHVYTYCGADTYGRFERMRGREVFQPIGFDSFGINTENYALRVGEHPARLTARTIARYREQLRRTGAAFAWRNEVVTSDPSYYRWTQWIFVRLHRAGLAYRAAAPVVWCPSCMTVLANEQTEDDRCERCRSPVTERVMEQWFLRITAYADRLLEGLDALDWPGHAKRRQAAWIGRSEGTDVDFRLSDGSVATAFTTRADTLWGVTFLAVAPAHALAARAGGLRAVNPATGDAVPVVVAEHVVGAYGTGVMMGVPAHDDRDFAFARARGLPVREVVRGGDLPFTGDGVLVASGPFTGIGSAEARDAITAWLEARGAGRRARRYRLRDWLISRQRYWGPPIPIVHCDACGPVAVPEDELPVVLPDLADVRPTGDSPLGRAPSFVETSCPSCAGPARRETDVSDVFFDSTWYFLRYCSSNDGDRAWDPDRVARMLPVDLYAGGPEHVARHHLYARFVCHALHDLGLLPFAEPFPRLRLHGTLVKDGAKMSKSRGNVVVPDDYFDRVGTDATRMYLLFCGRWEEGGDFTDAGLEGLARFTRRVWRLVAAPHEPGPGSVDMRPLDRTVARVGHDIEQLKLNTAIARLMECVRWAADERARMDAAQWERAARTIVLLLAPFAPHLAEECWARLGGAYSVHTQPWPASDPGAVREESVTLVVQVDGRVRDRIAVPAGLDEDEAVAHATASTAVRRSLDGREPQRVVWVPDRLVNLIR